MLRVILLRHSITAGNQKKRYIGTTDESLCPEGVALAKRKDHPAGQKLYASPMRRCMETAEIFYPGQKVCVVDSLRECDFGEFENKNYLELSDNPHYQQWIDSNGTLPFPGGETREMFQRRSVSAFDWVVEDALLQNLSSVAIVAHGGTVMSILERYGRPKGDYYSWHPENAGGYLLELDETSWQHGKKELHVIEKL